MPKQKTAVLEVKADFCRILYDREGGAFTWIIERQKKSGKCISCFMNRLYIYKRLYGVRSRGVR